MWGVIVFAELLLTSHLREMKEMTGESSGVRGPQSFTQLASLLTAILLCSCQILAFLFPFKWGDRSGRGCVSWEASVLPLGLCWSQECVCIVNLLRAVCFCTETSVCHWWQHSGEICAIEQLVLMENSESQEGRQVGRAG